MTDALANAARLLGEPARAAMLLKLMGGRAVPAGELAREACVSAQTASEHLARLTEAGFITAYRQGRHRLEASSMHVDGIRISPAGWAWRSPTPCSVKATYRWAHAEPSP